MERSNEESREKGGGAPCPSPQPQSQPPTMGVPKPINRDSLSGSEESCLLFIFRGCSPNLQCWGSWDVGGTGHRWTCGCHRDFDLEQKSQRHQVRRVGRWLQRCVHWGAVHWAPLLTNLTMPSPCREPASCLPGSCRHSPWASSHHCRLAALLRAAAFGTCSQLEGFPPSLSLGAVGSHSAPKGPTGGGRPAELQPEPAA